MSITLYPEQLQSVREVSMHYASGILAVLLRMNTGAGKTRTAAYIVEKFNTPSQAYPQGRQVLWLVHAEELLMQAAMTFAEFGIPHRLICAGKSERAIKAQQFRELKKSYVTNDAPLIICSIQTLVRRLDKLDWLNPSLMVPDECHLSLADGWRRVLDRWPTSKILGLTATPTRLDKRPFHKRDGGLYEVMVEGKSTKWLIANNRLARFEAYAPPIELDETVQVRMKKGPDGVDYNGDDLALQLDKPKIYGDVIEHYREYSLGKPAIGFCPNVKSARTFAAKFVEAGFKAISLDGETDDTLRRESLKALGRGEIDVIFSYGILIAGTDVPYATTALWLRKTESLTVYLQGCGRVLRYHPKKEFALFLDFVGVMDKHGLPDDDFEWSLDAPPVKRRAANDDEGPQADVHTQTCPKCRSIHLAAPACPKCGHVYEVKQRKEMEQVDGRLEKITAERAEEARKRRAARLAQGQAKSVDEIEAELRRQGKPNARKTAEKIFQARQDKSDLVGAIVDNFEAVREITEQPSFKTFGVTLSAVRNMKPKDLKALLARTIEERARVEAAAGQDNKPMLNIQRVA